MSEIGLMANPRRQVGADTNNRGVSLQELCQCYLVMVGLRARQVRGNQGCGAPPQMPCHGFYECIHQTN